MASFIQGFLASIVVDSNDVTPITVNAALARSTSALEKTVMDGSGFAASIPGLQSGSLNFDGHVSQAELNLLEVAYAKTVPVAFVLTIAEGLTTDGSYAGSFTFDTFDVDTAPDANWAFTASGPTVGAVVFTPSSP